MTELFDIFPKPYGEYQSNVRKCVSKNLFSCLNCSYVNTERDRICFDICLKGDFDLWLHNYDMNKPLLRRYIGSYEWEKKEK